MINKIIVTYLLRVAKSYSCYTVKNISRCYCDRRVCFYKFWIVWLTNLRMLCLKEWSCTTRCRIRAIGTSIHARRILAVPTHSAEWPREDQFAAVCLAIGEIPWVTVNVVNVKVIQTRISYFVVSMFLHLNESITYGVSVFVV